MTALFPCRPILGTEHSFIYSFVMFFNTCDREGSTVPYSDECLVPTPKDLLTHTVGNVTTPWLNATSGAIFSCLFGNIAYFNSFL